MLKKLAGLFFLPILIGLIGLTSVSQAQVAQSLVTQTCGALPTGLSFPVGQGRAQVEDSNGNGCSASTAIAVTATSRGITLTLGGTSQQIMAVNAGRHGFLIQNPCTATEQGIATAENAYVNFTAAAATNTNVNTAVLSPCSSFSMGIDGPYIDTEAINVNAATTGHIIYAKEF